MLRLYDSSLELQLHGKLEESPLADGPKVRTLLALNEPRRLRLSSGRKRWEQARNVSVPSGQDIEVGVVEGVEHLRAELQPIALRELEVFVDPEIEVPCPGHAEGIAVRHVSREIALQRIRSRLRAIGEFAGTHQTIHIPATVGASVQWVECQVVENIVALVFPAGCSGLGYSTAGHKAAAGGGICLIAAIEDSERIPRVRGPDRGHAPAIEHLLHPAVRVFGVGQLPNRAQ